MCNGSPQRYNQFEFVRLSEDSLKDTENWMVDIPIDVARVNARTQVCNSASQTIVQCLPEFETLVDNELQSTLDAIEKSASPNDLPIPFGTKVGLIGFASDLAKRYPKARDEILRAIEQFCDVSVLSPSFSDRTIALQAHLSEIVRRLG